MDQKKTKPKPRLKRSGWEGLVFALIAKQRPVDPKAVDGVLSRLSPGLVPIKQAVDELPEPLRLALVHRFGLSPDGQAAESPDPKALSEVGCALGCSASWASELCRLALRYLIFCEPSRGFVKSVEDLLNEKEAK